MSVHFNSDQVIRDASHTEFRIADDDWGSCARIGRDNCCRRLGSFGKARSPAEVANYERDRNREKYSENGNSEENRPSHHHRARDSCLNQRCNGSCKYCDQ